MGRRKRARAFSLLEIMMVMGLASLLVTLALLNLRSARSGAGSLGMATELAEQLKLARTRALRSQHWVALVSPSQGGRNPVAQGCILLAGKSRGRRVSLWNASGHLPESYLFSGQWQQDQAPGFSATAPAGYAREHPFAAEEWLGQHRQDPALIFTPQGTVVGHRIPFLEGAYRWVTCAGVEWLPGSDPLLAEASAFAKPCTLSVTPSGRVTFQGGLPGSSRCRLVASGWKVEAAPLPLSSPESGFSPTVESVELIPRSSDLRVAGDDATVGAGQRLSLRAVVREESGLQPLGKWVARKIGGGGPDQAGLLSHENAVPLSWDPELRRWIARIEWTAPLVAQPGDRYAFELRLGGSAQALVAALPAAHELQFEVVPTTRFYARVTGRLDDVSGDFVVQCNHDGSMPTVVHAKPLNLGPFSRLPNPKINLSADARSFLLADQWESNWFSVASGQEIGSTINTHAYAADLGKLTSRMLTYQRTGPSSSSTMFGRESPTALAIYPPASGRFNFLAQEMCQARSPSDGDYGAYPQALAWSPDEERIAFLNHSSRYYNSRQLNLMRSDGTQRQLLAPEVRRYSCLAWSRDGKTLYVGDSGELKAYDMDSGSFLNGGAPITRWLENAEFASLRPQVRVMSRSEPFTLEVSYDDNELLVAKGNEVWKCRRDGSEFKRVARLPGDIRYLTLGQR